MLLFQLVMQQACISHIFDLSFQDISHNHHCETCLSSTAMLAELCELPFASPDECKSSSLGTVAAAYSC